MRASRDSKKKKKHPFQPKRAIHRENTVLSPSCLCRFFPSPTSPKRLCPDSRVRCKRCPPEVRWEEPSLSHSEEKKQQKFPGMPRLTPFELLWRWDRETRRRGGGATYVIACFRLETVDHASPQCRDEAQPDFHRGRGSKMILGVGYSNTSRDTGYMVCGKFP